MHARATAAALSILAISLAACAARPEPRFVRADQLGKGELDGVEVGKQPIVIEFQEGDVIPMKFVVEGPFVHTEDDAKPIRLKVARRFFLRVDEDGLASSADGKTFDKDNAKPGSFRFGVSVTKEGVAAEMGIRTPTPEGLDEASSK